MRERAVSKKSMVHDVDAEKAGVDAGPRSPAPSGFSPSLQTLELIAEAKELRSAVRFHRGTFSLEDRRQISGIIGLLVQQLEGVFASSLPQASASGEPDDDAILQAYENFAAIHPGEYYGRERLLIAARAILALLGDGDAKLSSTLGLSEQRHEPKGAPE